jgi:DNA-binding MarR family transcriptional regulator
MKRIKVAANAAEPAWRHENFGRLLLNAFRYFERGLMVRLHAAGYKELGRVHLSVLRQVDFAGTRVTELADRVGVTKQAMSQFLSECEHLGFLERRADPTDGRAKLVYFTAKGRKFMASVQHVVESSEKEIVATLGAAEVARLREGLKKLAARLGADDMLGADKSAPLPASRRIST